VLRRRRLGLQIWTPRFSDRASNRKASSLGSRVERRFPRTVENIGGCFVVKAEGEGDIVFKYAL